MSILFYHSVQEEEEVIGGIDEYTKLMLHMDGDFGDTGHDIVSFGDPNFDSTIKKFNGSVHFDGNDYLQVPDHSDWVFGTSDFTIDFWARWDTSVASAGFMGQSNGGSSNLKWAVAWNAILAGNMTFHIQNPAGSTTNINWVWTPPAADTWYHLAIVRNGSSWYFFVDGVQTGGTQTSSIAVPDVSDPLNIGSDGENWAFFTGHMDEIRISDTARWTTGFDVPTAAYTSDSNTKLLIHADGDVSDSAHNVVMSSSPSFSNTIKKFGQSSADLSTSAWYVGDHTDWDFTSSDCTIDFWLYIDSFTVNAALLVGTATAAADGNWFIYTYTDGRIAVGRNGVNEIAASAGTVTAGQWYHIAVVKDSGTTTLYVDGTNEASNTTVVFNDSSNDLFIGGSGYTNSDVYIDELRISNTARWTTDFTPESGPYTE